jgi:hypothetical protein
MKKDLDIGKTTQQSRIEPFDNLDDDSNESTGWCGWLSCLWCARKDSTQDSETVMLETGISADFCEKQTQLETVLNGSTLDSISKEKGREVYKAIDAERRNTSAPKSIELLSDCLDATMLYLSEREQKRGQDAQSAFFAERVEKDDPFIKLAKKAPGHLPDWFPVLSGLSFIFLGTVVNILAVASFLNSPVEEKSYEQMSSESSVLEGVEEGVKIGVMVAGSLTILIGVPMMLHGLFRGRKGVSKAMMDLLKEETKGDQASCCSCLPEKRTYNQL